MAADFYAHASSLLQVFPVHQEGGKGRDGYAKKFGPLA
jgi:hypothetical protein